MSVSQSWLHPPEGCLVEGVGNEVLAVVVAILCLIFSLTLFVIQKHGLFIGRSRQVFGMRQGLLSQDEIDARIVASRIRVDTTCAFCLVDPTTYTVVTNCNHSFCGECMLRYWTTSRNLINCLNCAVCRTPVTLLIPVDWPIRDDQNGEILKEFERRVGDYNIRFSEKRNIICVILDLPRAIHVFIRFLLDYNGLLLMFRFG